MRRAEEMFHQLDNDGNGDVTEVSRDKDVCVFIFTRKRRIVFGILDEFCESGRVCDGLHAG